jgi:hypothetical protein
MVSRETKAMLEYSIYIETDEPGSIATHVRLLS